MMQPSQNEAGFSVVVRVQAARPGSYSLAEAAEIAGMPEALLRHYSRLGLFGAGGAMAAGEVRFDDAALYELRRFAQERRRYGLNRHTVRLLLELRREIERLQAEVRFLRAR